jgi:hypothetical protein
LKHKLGLPEDYGVQDSDEDEGAWQLELQLRVSIPKNMSDPQMYNTAAAASLRKACVINVSLQARTAASAHMPESVSLLAAQQLVVQQNPRVN